MQHTLATAPQTLPVGHHDRRPKLLLLAAGPRGAAPRAAGELSRLAVGSEALATGKFRARLPRAALCALATASSGPTPPGGSRSQPQGAPPPEERPPALGHLRPGRRELRAATACTTPVTAEERRGRPDPAPQPEERPLAPVAAEKELASMPSMVWGRRRRRGERELREKREAVGGCWRYL
jgi:hypothetical protein